MNIGLLLPRHARFRPDHVAVIFEAQRLTYAQLNRRVNRLANALLDLGVVQGDKIATVLPNCLEQLETYWAAAKIGAVVVPLSPLLRGAGLTRLADDADAAVFITNVDFAPILTPLKGDLPKLAADRYLLTAIKGGPIPPGYRAYEELTAAASAAEPPPVGIERDDPYNIIYSSGTTGLPKGIVHTHYIRGMYATLFANSYRFTPESVVLHTGSIIFNGSFLTLMPAMLLGCTYILHRQFDPAAFIETVARERVTHVMLVPSQIVALLHAPNFTVDKLQSLEMILSLGAPLLREHKDELTRLLPGRFYELYGLTEGFVTILDRDEVARKPNSVGAPPPFYEMRIVDPTGADLPPGEIGEIVGRGPITTPGYYKRPDLTAQALRDGWLYTGDLGYVDEDGYLYLVDRQKDMIISGGVNVYPRDIEEVIVRHPAVREAAVFGAPDVRWGESPVATVILNEVDAIAAEELRAWVNQRVDARYQQVRDLHIVEDFPRSVAGKTLKRVMREQLIETGQ